MTDSDIRIIEKEAHRLLEEKEYQEAAALFCRAADAHIGSRKHQQAALCFALAASCWALKAGEKTFHNAADMYEKGAVEAEHARDFEYAGLLYKHAASCHERDLEYIGYSECFYRSKECRRKSLEVKLFHIRKAKSMAQGETKEGYLKDRARSFISWCLLTFSWALWGHGERPQRTILFGFSIVLGFALLYTLGQLQSKTGIIRPNLLESLYFSVVTVTTVGYGDIVPLGLNKLLATLEAFSGLFVAPVFITGLCRKYLRF